MIVSIERLSNAGIDENAILAIDKIISMTGISHHLYKDKRQYNQNLMDDLQKYGNLNLAIKKILIKKFKKDRRTVTPSKETKKEEQTINSQR